MAYEKKLIIAKILVSLGLCLLILAPLTVDFSATHMTSPDWTPHARFHLAAASFGNIMALPIMLYAVWSKTLFGTGRSVRLMAYLGLAFTIGVFIAGALRPKMGAEYYDMGNQILIFGVDANIMMKGIVFILLILGIIMSIRRK